MKTGFLLVRKRSEPIATTGEECESESFLPLWRLFREASLSGGACRDIVEKHTEKEAAMQAAGLGHTDIVKYFVEERKISDEGKFTCVGGAAAYGRLDCLKYLLGEEAKAPLNFWHYIAYARYCEHPDCENYLLEKGCPEPTDEEYAWFIEQENRLREEITRS
ncbi:unnamed protein product [Bathycoccus prasinos]